jgi:hypothetical protein
MALPLVGVCLSWEMPDGIRSLPDLLDVPAIINAASNTNISPGPYAAAFGDLDTLVFVGGIGGNAPLLRQRICAGLGVLGIDLNQKRNAKNAAAISTGVSRATVCVIRTDEELRIARSVCRAFGLGMASEKGDSDHTTKSLPWLNPVSAERVTGNSR